MCVIKALNLTISSEELDYYKWYESLIFGRKCVTNDAGPQEEWIVVCNIARRVKDKGSYMEDLNSTVFSLERRPQENIGYRIGSLQYPFKFGLFIYFPKGNKK